MTQVALPLAISERLQQRAAQAQCSVEALLTRWLDEAESAPPSALVLTPAPQPPNAASQSNAFLLAMNQITLDLLNQHEMSDLLNSIVMHTATIIDASHAELMLLEGDTLFVKATTPHMTFTLGESTGRDVAPLTWQAVDTKQIVTVDNYKLYPKRRPVYDAATFFAVACIPILIGEQCLGALDISRDREGYLFTPEDLDQARQFAQLIALVLQHVQLRESLLQRFNDKETSEQKLRQSEARLRSFLEAQTTYVIRTDLEGRYTYCNQQFLQRYGWLVGDYLGQSVATSVMLVDHDKMIETTQACLDEPGKPFQVVLRKPAQDGGIRWTLWEFVTINNAAGNVDEIQCIGFDITAYEMTKIALQKSDHQLSQIMATIQDIVWSVNLLDLQTVYINQAVSDLLEIPVDTFYQSAQSGIALLFGNDHTIIDGFQEAMTTDEYGEWRHKMTRSDGTVRSLYTRAWLVNDMHGTPIQVAGITTDITAAQLAQQLLNVRQKALESTANAIMLASPEWTIQWVNPAFTQLTGYSFHEAVGRTPGELLRSGVHEQAFFDAIAQTNKSGKVWFGKLTNRRKDGTLYLEEQTVTPVIDAEGQITHMIAVKQDITEREQAEQLRLEQERLRASLQKEQEFHTMVQRAVSALNHDIRTPLAVISATKDTLRLYFDRLDEEKRREKLDSIDKQLRHVLEMLNDVATVVKGTLTSNAFNPQAVNLAALCQISVNEIEATSGIRHEFRFETDGQIVTVLIDQTLISRILINLLSNAVKYSPVGSLVTLSLTRADQWIVLRVTDQGVGIPASEQSAVFEPLYRALNVGKVEGTGLGLSIVRDYVERHQGTVVLESTVGVGTTITVKIPLHEESFGAIKSDLL